MVCIGQYVCSCMPSAPSGHDTCVYCYDNRTIGVSILCRVLLCKAVCKCDLVTDDTLAGDLCTFRLNGAEAEGDEGSYFSLSVTPPPT